MAKPLTNASTDGDSALLVVDADEQMGIYDRLPARLKALYDSAPVPIDAREFRAVLAAYGEDYACQLITQLLQNEYPGWTGAVVRRGGKNVNT
jgi:hypothetical protein